MLWARIRSRDATSYRQLTRAILAADDLEGLQELTRRLGQFDFLRWALRASINRLTWREALLAGPQAFLHIVLQVATHGDWIGSPSQAVALRTCCVCSCRPIGRSMVATCWGRVTATDWAEIGPGSARQESSIVRCECSLLLLLLLLVVVLLLPLEVVAVVVVLQVVIVVVESSILY